MAKRNLFILACVISAGSLAQINAQTTLSGDHIITGKLDVGTTGAPGGIEVSGQTGNTAAPGIKLTGDGGVVFMGTLGVGQIPTIGAGTRFMWYPRKGALRAGEFSSGQLDDPIIGVGSVAFTRSYAVGEYSIAANEGAADGRYSAALSGSSASGEYSTSLSGGNAFGASSTAMNLGDAYGAYSTAMAKGSAVGESSTAMANGLAMGSYASAMSAGTAAGEYSTAMSTGQAMGSYSTASGKGTVAWSYGSFVVGRSNSYPFSESWNEWVPTDSLFVVGNGTGISTDPAEVRNRNALTVYKNGKVQMSGDVQMTKRQGDIEMGDFGVPGSGD